MMAAAAAVKEEEELEAGGCSLYRCFCCWRRVCSPRIPRVAPGRDYLCIPIWQDKNPDWSRPAWSMHVGFLSNSGSVTPNDSVLRLHRFRVARSGRILGRSDDALDMVRTVRTIKGCSCIVSASAAVTSNGCSLSLFSEHLDPGKTSAVPRAYELQVGCKDQSDMRAWSATPKDRSKITMSPLPRLPMDCHMKCRPVSAAGHLWAANIELEVPTSKCFVGMLRLNRDGELWEKAGDTFCLPLRREELIQPRWGGSLFQGYAVLHDNTILISLRADQGLLTFNCSDCTWTEVTTTKDTFNASYVPILGRGVYIRKHSAVYFLRDNRIFAYKLDKKYHLGSSKEKYHRGSSKQKYHREKLELEPPVLIDSICPFDKEGYGFLTHHAGDLLCSVWISTLLCCSRDYLHVIITTFRVRSPRDEQEYIPKGIDIIHSTCRRLHVPPLELPIHDFCFLESTRAHKEVQPSLRDYPTSSPVIEEFSKRLDCCSNFLSESACYKFEKPPQDPALQINKDLYIIGKAGCQLIVYVAKIKNGWVWSHDNFLEKKYELVSSCDCDDYHVFEQLPPWHLVFSSCSSKIYAVSNTQDGIHELSLSLTEKLKKDQCKKPNSDPFFMVLEVGDKIVAVSYTLHVFYHDKPNWVCCSRRADKSLVPNGKANLSGYAVLDGDSFIVSDADTGSFLLFDMRSGRWSVLRRALPESQLLKGRSIFVDGFIYTCTSGGLLAYGLDQQGNSHKDLSDPIFLKFSWQFSHSSWVAERMCLDCVDKGKNSDTIVFCVVQGEYRYSRSLPGGNSTSHDVHITTVQVKTERACGGKRKPESIDHLGIGTCFIEHDAALVCTKSCFAVGS